MMMEAEGTSYWIWGHEDGLKLQIVKHANGEAVFQIVDTATGKLAEITLYDYRVRALVKFLTETMQ